MNIRFAPIAHTLVVCAHVAAAALVIMGLFQTWQNRQAEISHLEHAADIEHQRTLELEHQVAIQQATLEGLHASDPYVVELQARTRLGWTGQGEIRPPPRPDQAAER